jgi:hypothetical protein
VLNVNDFRADLGQEAAIPEQISDYFAARAETAFSDEGKRVFRRTRE